MNKNLILNIVVSSLLITSLAHAQTQKKNVKMDPENIKKASQVIAQNRAIFDNPELLKKFIQLNQSLKK